MAKLSQKINISVIYEAMVGAEPLQLQWAESTMSTRAM
jgi:hypothetical protein